MEEKIREYLNQQPGEQAVFIKDLTDGETLCFHEKAVFPSASTIKLVIMACLLDQVKTGRLSLEDPVVLTEEMRTGGDGILKELSAGHRFSLREILTLMIIVSDNTATNILIELMGMDAVNEMAGRLGLSRTVLGRRMMDSEARKQGKDNYTCAGDIAHILELIYEQKCVDVPSSRLMLDILRRQQQSGRLQLYLPEEVEIAHKCGDLDFLEHDAGIVLLPKRPYLIVVLTRDNPTNKDGREVIGTVSRMVYEEMLQKE
ncbi:serine hydrolase [Faecalispora jeddahensis]|uniref:serine hydrolase n=1 Tax=Faecalispora jeddahensis TaxID=1414721 RepID=UPI0027B9AB89|nr:serine hydrolase [Faecalispora jeddahensis]